MLLPLAANIDSIVTPYFSAIAVNISPARTSWLMKPISVASVTTEPLQEGEFTGYGALATAAVGNTADVGKA